jgi:hypothetical protein
MWLHRKTWKEMMQATGLSSGSISNIVSRWKKNLGDLDPEAVRQFISTTEKEGMPTLSQCAEGFRTANMLAELGMADNQAGELLKNLRECLGADISPQHLARLLKEVVDFSRKEGFPLAARTAPKEQAGSNAEARVLHFRGNRAQEEGRRSGKAGT